MAHNGGGKSSAWIIIIGVIIFFSLVGSCSREKDHNDGKCDICDKPSTYSDGTEEYCSQHLRDAVEWYVKQGQK